LLDLDLERERRLVGEPERFLWLVGYRDDVPPSIGVNLNRIDRFSRAHVELSLDDAGGVTNAVEAADRLDPSNRQHSRARGEKTDRERLPKFLPPKIGVQRLTQRLPQRDLEQVDADADAHKICHLSSWDPSRDFDDVNLRPRHDQLRESDPFAQP
jgi:hypothetical protein